MYRPIMENRIEGRWYHRLSDACGICQYWVNKVCHRNIRPALLKPGRENAVTLGEHTFWVECEKKPCTTNIANTVKPR